jgi:hypothetical protein
MIAFSRTCRFCVRSRALGIFVPPEPLFTAILSALAADLLPLRSDLTDLDF